MALCKFKLGLDQLICLLKHQ